MGNIFPPSGTFSIDGFGTGNWTYTIIIVGILSHLLNIGNMKFITMYFLALASS